MSLIGQSLTEEGYRESARVMPSSTTVTPIVWAFIWLNTKKKKKKESNVDFCMDGYIDFIQMPKITMKS